MGLRSLPPLSCPCLFRKSAFESSVRGNAHSSSSSTSENEDWEDGLGPELGSASDDGGSSDSDADGGRSISDEDLPGARPQGKCRCARRFWRHVSPMWRPAQSILKLLVHLVVFFFMSYCFAHDAMDHVVPALGTCSEGRRLLWNIRDATVGFLALLMVVVFELVRRDTSRLAQRLHTAMTLGWVVSLFEFVLQLLRDGRFSYGTPFHIMYLTVDLMWNYVSQGTVLGCIEMISEAFGMPLGARVIKIVSYGMALSRLFCIILFAVIQHALDREILTGGLVVFLVSDLVVGLSWVVVLVVSWLAVNKVCDSMALPPAAHGDDYLHSEADWALHVLRRVRWGVAAKCFGFTLFWTLIIVDDFFQFGTDLASRDRDGVLGSNGVRAGLIIAILIDDGITLRMIFGFCQEQQPEFKLVQTMPALQETSSILLTRSSPWVLKVQELAERSIEAGTLLRFYTQLGEDIMPHYNPWRHTTNDVVRAAIIPCTRHGEGGRAFAGLPGSGDGPGFPDIMVSHTWSMHFVHLVAAVVANALGLDEYNRVESKLLHGGAHSLEERLAAAGTSKKRYWICAFCVNQHANICGSFGPTPPGGTPDFERWDASRHDSGTGQPHSCCPCTEPKFFNDQADQCEMNKFDDMMEMMHAAHANLRQLVVVDPNLEVFSRLWCVAECVQSSLLRLPQDVCLFSSAALDAESGDFGLYADLATLSVSSCRATRPEDKEAIMAKISNVHAFDAHLQALIFGKRGLLGRRMVGFDVLRTAAHSAARINNIARSRTLPLSRTGGMTASSDARLRWVPARRAATC